MYLVSIVPYDTHFVPRDDSDLKLDLRCDCVVSRSHFMPLSLVGDDVSNKLAEKKYYYFSYQIQLTLVI